MLVVLLLVLLTVSNVLISKTAICHQAALLSRCWQTEGEILPQSGFSQQSSVCLWHARQGTVTTSQRTRVHKQKKNSTQFMFRYDNRLLIIQEQHSYWHHIAKCAFVFLVTKSFTYWQVEMASGVCNDINKAFLSNPRLPFFNIS